MKENFVEARLKQIPWTKNSKIDELAHLASSIGDWLSREVIMQMKLLPQMEMGSEREEVDWRTEFRTNFQEGKLPLDPMQAQ